MFWNSTILIFFTQQENSTTANNLNSLSHIPIVKSKPHQLYLTCLKKPSPIQCQLSPLVPPTLFSFHNQTTLHLSPSEIVPWRTRDKCSQSCRVNPPFIIKKPNNKVACGLIVWPRGTVVPFIYYNYHPSNNNNNVGLHSNSENGKRLFGSRCLLRLLFFPSFLCDVLEEEKEKKKAKCLPFHCWNGLVCHRVVWMVITEELLLSCVVEGWVGLLLFWVASWWDDDLVSCIVSFWDEL